jgi:DNA segregation ATPase FtsK/SpoIIIE-like protein
MARSRKSSAQRKTQGLEILGIGIFGAALILAVPMFRAPEHSGAVGYFVRTTLVVIFGAWARYLPLVLFLSSLGCYLEDWVEGAFASLTSLAVLSFFLTDIGFAQGFLGSFFASGLHAIFGRLTNLVLSLLCAMIVFNLVRDYYSPKRAVTDLFRLLKAGGAFLFEARLPHPRTVASAMGFGRGRQEKVERGRGVANPARTPVATKVVELPLLMRAPLFQAEEDDEELRDIPPAADRPKRGVAVAPALGATVVDVTPKRRFVDTVSEDLQWSAEEQDDDGGSARMRERRNYRLPDLSLFDPPMAQIVDDSSRAELLVETLSSFDVKVRVVHRERGPSITRYEVKPEKGVKISRITALADDIALALAATSVRIEAPIPGKSAVGIEVPNAVVSVVAVREIIEALPPLSDIALPMALGKDITGRPVFADLAKMPHLLVAGATGAGKSVCLNNIIASLLASATPDQVQMLMVDPKRVELTVYNGIPHLVKDVITDARMAAGALFEMTKEMDSRYERFAKASVRKIEEYNRKFPDESLPYVVIIIDELADLMLVAPAKVETTICRLAQLARATGIHLVVATQRPSVDVITGIIKANIPSRIAFAVSSQVDSRTILDMAGAERLLGRGDMLFLPIDAPKPRRVQGALVTGEEVSRIVAFWAAQGRPKNLVDVDVVPMEDDDSAKTIDPLSYDAARFIIESNYASTAQLQTQFQIGHPRAVRLMKGLEEMKVVGVHEGTKPRKILIGLADLELMASRFGKEPEGRDATLLLG